VANVLVLIGAGQIGQAIARRVGIGKHVLLADMGLDNANAAADVLGNARCMIQVSAAARPGTPDEVGTVGALLVVPTVGSSPAATSSWTVE